MSGFKSPNYTQVPNDFFDMAKDMSEAELRFTLAMLRETFGFHRRQTRAGISDVMEKTGMSDQGVRNGASAAEERGTVTRLNPDTKTKAEWEVVLIPNDVDPNEKGVDLDKHPNEKGVDTPTPLTTVTVLKKEKKVIKKKGDYFDMLKDMQSGSEKSQRIAETLDRLDVAFKTHFPRNTTGENIAKFVMQQEAKGESLDRFVTWAYRDEFNASRVYEYAETPSKIKTRWALAFDQTPKKKIAGQFTTPKPGL